MKTFKRTMVNGIVMALSALLLAACGSSGGGGSSSGGTVVGLGNCPSCAAVGINGGSVLSTFNANYLYLNDRVSVTASLYGAGMASPYGYGSSYGASSYVGPVAIAGQLFISSVNSPCYIPPGTYQLSASTGYMQQGYFYVRNVQAIGPATLTVDFGDGSYSNSWLLHGGSSANGYIYVRSVNGMFCADPGYLLI